MVHLVSQDLSVAGQRKGLKHEDNGDDETTRSGLFFEAIRVIREMRERDKSNGRTGYLVRPRFIVFENVPGLFSSNKGEDFKTALVEIVKLSESEAPDLPMPDKGRWTKSGCIYDEMGRWSIAWRVHDAQFWGVPQRRKRIALVADFGGLSAPEILFERKGMSWYSAESRAEGEGTAGGTENGITSTITATYGTKWNGNAGSFSGGNFVIEKQISEQPVAAISGQAHGVLVKEPIPIHDKATRYKGGGDTRHNDGSANGLGIGRAGDPSPTLSAGDRHSVLCLNDQGGANT